MTVRAVSFGGGVQSTALLVLAAQGEIDFNLFLFANVGHDSEHPDTIAYMERFSVPYAAEHGIELVELQRHWKNGPRRGTPVTLYSHLMDPTSRSVNIPVRMAGGAPGTRNCTERFKIKVIADELKRRGATVEDPAIVALGISVDEIERAKPGTDQKLLHQSRVYPLLELGLRRHDCKRLIADAGLPVPPKSACWFCPFHEPSAWQDMKRNRPDLFAKAEALEATFNARRDELGKDHVFLTGTGRPLGQSVSDQMVLPGLDGCDSGWCMT